MITTGCMLTVAACELNAYAGISVSGCHRPERMTELEFEVWIRLRNSRLWGVLDAVLHL